MPCMEEGLSRITRAFSRIGRRASRATEEEPFAPKRQKRAREASGGALLSRLKRRSRYLYAKLLLEGRL